MRNMYKIAAEQGELQKKRRNLQIKKHLEDPSVFVRFILLLRLQQELLCRQLSVIH